MVYFPVIFIAFAKSTGDQLLQTLLHNGLTECELFQIVVFAYSFVKLLKCHTVGSCRMGVL